MILTLLMRMVGGFPYLCELNDGAANFNLDKSLATAEKSQLAAEQLQRLLQVVASSMALHQSGYSPGQ